MGITRHAKVLGALEKRALRYRRKGQAPIDKDKALYNEAIDETGTVPLGGLLDSIDKSSGTETAMTTSGKSSPEIMNGLKKNPPCPATNLTSLIFMSI